MDDLDNSKCQKNQKLRDMIGILKLLMRKRQNMNNCLFKWKRAKSGQKLELMQ